MEQNHPFLFDFRTNLIIRFIIRFIPTLEKDFF